MKKLLLFIFINYLFSLYADNNSFLSQKKIREEIKKYYSSGNYKESIKYCLKALNSYPDDESSMLLLAYSYLNIYDYKKAERTFIDILKKYPSNHYAKSQFANLYSKLIQKSIKENNINLAFNYIKKAQYYLPDIPYFYDLDAELNLTLFNYEEALNQLLLSWKNDPLPEEKKVEVELWKLYRITDCYKRLGFLYMKDLKKIIFPLQKKYPNNKGLLNLVADIYFFNNEEPIKRNNFRNKALKLYLNEVGERNSISVNFPLKGRYLVISGEFEYLLDTHNGFDAYCIDLVKIDNNKNRIFKGDGSNNSDYLSYNEPVYAVMDGIVESVSNNAYENQVGTPNWFSSNYVKIKHEVNNEIFYSLYVHLKRDSITVAKGQFIKKNDMIGRIGNSGLSYAPHLHFGLYDKNMVSLPITFIIDNKLQEENETQVNNKIIIKPAKNMVIIN